MNRTDITGTYRGSNDITHSGSLNLCTGKITLDDGVIPNPTEYDEYDHETFFVRMESTTFALNICRGESEELIAEGSNFDTIQSITGNKTRLYVFKVHESIENLDFMTMTLHKVGQNEDVEEMSAKYLLNWYGEGNVERADVDGRYTVEFNNSSLAYITYAEINKEDWNVIEKYI